jgi:hypothetical protein
MKVLPFDIALHKMLHTQREEGNESGEHSDPARETRAKRSRYSFGGDAQKNEQSDKEASDHETDNRPRLRTR